MRRLLTVLSLLLIAGTAVADSSTPTIILVGTEVRIDGTKLDDRVVVSEFDGDLVVELFNENDYIFDVYLLSEVKRVRCYLRQGDDTYDGSQSNVKTRVFGGGGNDSIFGSQNRDRLVGNAGSDTIFGNGERDNISGNGGNDYLDGGSDADILRGSGGRDLIAGGGGLDQIDGGDGQDILVGGELDADWVAFSGIIDTWTSGRDNTFDQRVIDVVSSSPVLYDDFELDFVNGGKEADLYFDQADELIVDGVGWPSQTSPPAEGDRVDAIF